ncbi:transposable element Tc1 transposase [Trichonephila clavipes]|nr:transposable element Tc1 transposase [Trichonephila clavipes]
MVVGARLTGVSSSRTINLVGVSGTTLSSVMTVYTDLGKVSSEKHNSKRKTKLKDHDKRMLKKIVTRKRKSTLPQVMSEMNTLLQNHVFMKTIHRELHTADIHGRVAIPNPLDSAGKECYEETRVTTRHVFGRKTPSEVFHVDCLVPTVKHGRGSVMVWDAISFRGLGPLVVLEEDDHRRPLLKHSRRLSSPYTSDSLSGRTSLVPR